MRIFWPCRVCSFFPAGARRVERRRVANFCRGRQCNFFQNRQQLITPNIYRWSGLPTFQRKSEHKPGLTQTVIEQFRRVELLNVRTNQWHFCRLCEDISSGIEDRPSTHSFGCAQSETFSRWRLLPVCRVWRPLRPKRWCEQSRGRVRRKLRP